ncbi:hypothetical protein SGCOL_000518 [Colletotrichum sp. CLE4]
MKAWYGEDVIKRTNYILTTTTSKNLIDDPANMICLTWQLHKYWTDGKFMLKPRGRPYEVAVVDDSVGPRSARKQKEEEFRWCQEIVIHWLRWTTLEGMQADADYSTDPREHFQPLDHETAVSLETGYSVADGKTIKVFADCEADVPSYANLLTAFSLTAVADPKLYESDDDSVVDVSELMRLRAEKGSNIMSK